MFEKFDEAALDVVAASRHECLRMHCQEVEPRHVLLALTRDPGNVAARALATMNINADNIQSEIEKAAKAARGEGGNDLSPMIAYEGITVSQASNSVFARAEDYRRFFGRELVSPEHILLALADLKDDAALRILEELGANFIFLRRQVLNFVAKLDCLSPQAPGARNTVISGIADIIAGHMESIASLQRLSDVTSGEMASHRMPDRSEVVLMVFLAYLPEFLFTQVAYQRYLLEETLKLLQLRTGPLDKETIASMVSASAQNLRAHVRSIIEHLWTQEYKVLSQMPDEAEHEEIGSIIEDLWWTYSEEIALHDVFDEALDDYRRKHVIDLQKGKLELSQRLNKTKIRLDETLKQCFLKRSLSA
jgi:Clp amino terminal domain, pathogenicity island component